MKPTQCPCAYDGVVLMQPPTERNQYGGGNQVAEDGEKIRLWHGPYISLAGQAEKLSADLFVSLHPRTIEEARH